MELGSLTIIDRVIRNVGFLQCLRWEQFVYFKKMGRPAKSCGSPACQSAAKPSRAKRSGTKRRTG